MSPPIIFNNTIQLHRHHPPGTIVYHKATEEKGIIVGYITYSDGSSRFLVDFSPIRDYEFLTSTSLTTTPPLPTSDEAWKQTN